MSIDLMRYDRRVAAAVAADARVRAALARLASGAEEPADPWPAHREVSGKRAFDSLREAAVSTADVPLRDALLAWIAELTARRITFPLEAQLAQATSAPAATGAAPGAAGRRGPTWREAIRSLLASQGPGEARSHLVALAGAAPRIAALDAERRATRAEVLARLGVEAPRPPADTTRALDELTEDVAREVCRVPPGAEPFPMYLDLRLARRAAEGWPARLAWRWVADVLPAFAAGPAPRMGAAPEAFGAASFARALRTFGEAYAAAARPAGPFALRNPTRSVFAASVGCALGALPAMPVFYKRRMGLSSGTCRDQARAVTAAILLSARDLAARSLHDGSRASLEELTARVLGPDVPPPVAAVLLRPRDHDADDLGALLLAIPLLDELRDRFDEDWFDNPRATEHLRARAAASPWEAVPEPGADDARRLARRLEEALA